jgi:hypothetical protein
MLKKNKKGQFFGRFTGEVKKARLKGKTLKRKIVEQSE